MNDLVWGEDRALVLVTPSYEYFTPRMKEGLNLESVLFKLKK